MFLSSDLGNSPLIIDERNADKYVADIADPSTPFTGGYVQRDYELGTYASAYRGDIMPRSEWDSHIQRQERDKSSPDDFRIAADVPILDQNGLGYCWMYGTVGAIMTVYAMTGLPVPHLSATGPAAQGKNWANRGGWAGEAIEYIRRYGIPTLDAWPEHSMDRSLPRSPEVQRTAKLHGLVDFAELPRNNFDAAVSVLLDPVDPRPVTLGLNWWGHLVYATKVVKLGAGRYGLKIANSWRPTWGQQGTAVLVESKATAFEQIAVQRVKPRAA